MVNPLFYRIQEIPGNFLRLAVANDKAVNGGQGIEKAVCFNIDLFSGIA